MIDGTVDGSVGLTENGVTVELSVPGGPRRGKRLLLLVDPQLYTQGNAEVWPSQNASGVSLLVARVDGQRYCANAELLQRVVETAALESVPILVPDDAVKNRGTGLAASRQRHHLIRARFRPAGQRRSRTVFAALAAAAVLALLLLAVATTRLLSARREAEVAREEHAAARTALEQSSRTAAAIEAERNAAERLLLEVPLPGAEIVSAAVELFAPGDTVFTFQRRGDRFSLSGRITAAERVAAGLQALPGIGSVTVTTSRSDTGTESTISGRLAE
jgi:hypothetical protein